MSGREPRRAPGDAVAAIRAPGFWRRVDDFLYRWRIFMLIIFLTGVFVYGLTVAQDAVDLSRDTIHSADLRGGRATRRVSQLLTQVDALRADEKAAAADRATLAAKIDALVAQVQALGASPVATSGPSEPATPMTLPATTPTTRCTLNVLGVCI